MDFGGKDHEALTEITACSVCGDVESITLMSLQWFHMNCIFFEELEC